jgi:cytochrome c oxidase subunit 1
MNQPRTKALLGVSYDHKVIVPIPGPIIVLMAVDSSFALTFRLSWSMVCNSDLMEYNTLMSLHGMVMIIGILVGIGAFMNYLIPLMLGARDMAFPRLNAFSFWLAVPASLILLSSMALGGFDTG